ncbi:hypothetical protein ACL02T_27540 [Pseudonocardia sp. RS010]|uniref:hypothetical protein n=1 Tax=Pseudonocardia sp. RS010 TaxID=3385979 RepID=UPI00399F58FE
MSRFRHAGLRLRWAVGATAAAALTTASLLVAPMASADPAEPGPACTGEEVLQVSPGLSALTPGTGRVDNAGVLGTETCLGDALGYTATGPIRIEHHIEYGVDRPSTCTDISMKGYALHHIPTADGVVTVRNDFVATLGAFQGEKFSGTYGFVPLEGDCVTAPLTKFKVVYAGYFNDNSRD